MDVTIILHIYIYDDKGKEEAKPKDCRLGVNGSRFQKLKAVKLKGHHK